MTDLKQVAIPLFKAINPGDKITVINPPETFVHYHYLDAIQTQKANCIMCKEEKEQKRAIARSFGPRPKWMRGE